MAAFDELHHHQAASSRSICKLATSPDGMLLGPYSLADRLNKSHHDTSHSELHFVCPPLSSRDVAPIQNSADTWASVIANVAPLVALIGERNAKEHMRTASSWHQFLPLAAAPLGILSIMVSALRLTGSSVLRRLVGRNSERRSEALVELTPLSVAPATSVYTSRAVEIEPSSSRDRAAFVCGHTKTISDANKAVDGFKELMDRRDGNLQEDKDREIVLVVWDSPLGLQQVGQLIKFFASRGPKGSRKGSRKRSYFDSLSSASLSFRTTGVSPTQVANDVKSRAWLFYQWKDVVAAFGFLALLVGIQVINYHKQGSPSIFWMGLCGYLGVMVFTFGLLLMIKGEVVLEPELLPSVFKDAYWTFSDSRHAEHRPTKGPRSNALITARPAQHSPEERRRRNHITFLLTVGVIASYILWYLSLRVSPWWVALSNLGVIWLAAAYRAVVAQNFLTASKEDVGSDEHWIGLFHDTVSESLLATVNGAWHRAQQNGSEKASPMPSSISPQNADDMVIMEEECSRAASSSRQTVLFVVPSLRTDLRTWSSAENVIELGLKMARRSCQRRTLNIQRIYFSGYDWAGLVRFKMAIYVPGLVWKATRSVDFAYPVEHNLESLARHMMKLLHVCMDHEGEITRHSVRNTSRGLCRVLGGSITTPPVESDSNLLDGISATLRRVLTALRDVAHIGLNQAILLPVITLACIHQEGIEDADSDPTVKPQKERARAYYPGGDTGLATLEEEFERLKLWDHFMKKNITRHYIY